MPDTLAYLNGAFVPYPAAALPFHDAGLVFGATVTDFCRTFGQRLFRWPEHLARFRRDCAACEIPLHATDDDLTSAAERLITQNATGSELALITFATPGPLGHMIGVPSRLGEHPTLGMHTFPLPTERYRDYFIQGVRLRTLPAHDFGGPPLPRVKHRSRLTWWLAERAAQRLEVGSLALLMADGQATDTAIGALIAVVNGVVTCPPEELILDSISLRVLRELCAAADLSFRAAPFDLDAASEVMLTGTAFCLAGVSSIDGRALPWPGPIAQQLMDAWQQVVGLDYVAQLLGK